MRLSLHGIYNVFTYNNNNNDDDNNNNNNKNNNNNNNNNKNKIIMKLEIIIVKSYKAGACINRPDAHIQTSTYQFLVPACTML